VVRAGRGLGFFQPEDVRWCRLSHHRAPGAGAWSLFNPLSWTRALAGAGTGPQDLCTCGHGLPLLERYDFTFDTGRRATYRLGQCAHCRTIYWEEA
jgi:hypothetical protein